MNTSAEPVFNQKIINFLCFVVKQYMFTDCFYIYLIPFICSKSVMFLCDVSFVVFVFCTASLTVLKSAL